MKKGLKNILLNLLTVSLFLISVGADESTHNWYCVHVKDHIQPRVGSDIAFAEELGGCYIDHSHTDANASDKVIYLTFDAGYENGNVEKILNVMRDEGVTGAFFILGNLIEKNPDLVRRMADEGHLVCNHTLRHKDMTTFDEQAFLDELHALEQLYEDTTGQKMAPYYRPPEGRFNAANLRVAQKNGYRTVFWSFAYPDWDNNKQLSSEKAKSIIMENIHNGEVMLLHPTSATNAAILGEVIQALKADGFRFGTLDELTTGGNRNVALW